MSSPEYPEVNDSSFGAEVNSDYFTDGQYLYEVAETSENYGLAGGTFTTLREFRSGRTRTVDGLHMLLLTAVQPEEDA